MADEHANTDHDLLIRLDTKMDRHADDMKSLGHRVEEVKRDVQVLSDGFEVKLAAAVSGKLDTQRAMEMKAEADALHKDHENRLRFIERIIWGSGALTATGAVAGGAIYLFHPLGL